MRKSSLFISAVLTTFVLAILSNVVSAYQNRDRLENITSTEKVELAQVVETPTSTPLPAPTQLALITPEEAADIASKIMGKTDLYSVEFSQFEGIDAYLVTFSSGDIVYVSTSGQILSISKLPVTIVTIPNNNTNDNNSNASNNNRGHDDDEHGEDEEHDEHEDD